MRPLPIYGQRKKATFPLRVTDQAETAAAEAHQEFFKELFDLLPGLSWSALVREDPQGKEVRSESETCHPETCNHEKEKEKKFTPNEINDIDRQFRDAVGANTAIQVDALSLSWLDGTFDSSSIDGSTTWKAKLLEMLRKVLAWAHRNTVERYGKLPEFLRNELGAALTQLSVSPSLPWITELFNEGFQLVQNKILRVLIPEIKLAMVEAIGSGMNWQQISRLLYRKYGKGSLWQWQRLVRSEMARAIDVATREQYTASGVQAVRWSAARNACPICSSIAQKNGGYYQLDSAPRVVIDTHPNCRCLIIEVWRLPQGVEV